MAVQVEPQTQTRKMTYADYAALPDDGHRYQVIEGELNMTPAPNVSHQRSLRRLLRAIEDHARSTGMGEVLFASVDVVLSEETVLQPDLLFISKDRSKIITEANVQGAPDLVAEVLSPGSTRLDKGQKRDVYARFGVREYWLVSPEAETIEVLVLRGQAYQRLGLFGSGDQVSSEVLSGLTLKTDAVFER